MRWKVHSWLCFGREFRCFGVKDWFLRSSFDHWRGGRGRRLVVCSWCVVYRVFEGWKGHLMKCVQDWIGLRERPEHWGGELNSLRWGGGVRCGCGSEICVVE